MFRNFKRKYLPRAQYYGHAGKEIANDINSTFHVNDYLNSVGISENVIDEPPYKRQRMGPKRLFGASTQRRKRTIVYRKPMTFKRRYPKTFARKRTYKKRSYASKRTGVRTGYSRPTVMNIAESKKVNQVYSQPYPNDTEVVQLVTMPTQGLTDTESTFIGRRIYANGIKFYFSFYNLNLTNDKMVCVKVFKIDPDDPGTALNIYKSHLGEFDSTINSLPLILRPKAQLNKHTVGMKEVYRRNIVLGRRNAATNDSKNYRHWKCWVPINEVLKYDVGEDNGPSVLNKRYVLRIYQINATGETTPVDGLATVSGNISSTFYFKDI